MLGYYTHLYFAQVIKDKMSYAGGAVTRLYPDAYRMGALGADVLSPIGRTAAELDVANPYDLFEETAVHIYGSGSKCQLSYMLGMLTHYVIDSRVNPYLYYMAENGVPHYFDEGRDMLTYDEICASVDLHVANAYLEGKTPEIRKEACKIQADVAEDIAKLYERAVCRVVQHAMNRKDVERCLTEAKLGEEPRGCNLPELDYLNRNHRTWETVRNGQWTSQFSFDELLKRLEPMTLRMVDDYMSRVRSGYELNRRAFQINHLGIMVQ